MLTLNPSTDSLPTVIMPGKIGRKKAAREKGAGKKCSEIGDILTDRDANLSDLTLKELKKLLRALFRKINEGDKKAEISLIKCLKARTSTDLECDQGVKLWLFFFEINGDQIPLESMPIIKAYAKCNSPAVVRSAAGLLCRALPVTKDDALTGVRSLIKGAIGRHDFAEEGDLTEPEDRAKILAATLEGILSEGDPRVLAEFSKASYMISHVTLSSMFRGYYEGNEAEILFMLQTLGQFRSDHPVYAHYVHVLYNLPDSDSISETGGIETWQVDFGRLEKRLVSYQSFSHFIQSNSGLINHLRFKEGNSIYMTQIIEDWSPRKKTRKPAGAKAICLG